jgi:hypothetical protein
MSFHIYKFLFFLQISCCSFIHLFFIDLLQDMETVIFIIIQKKKKAAAYSIYVYKL